MSYTKTIWQDGDIITSEKLNKMEQGIYDTSNSNNNGGTFYIKAELEQGKVVDSFTITLVNNVTGQQILDAINNDMSIIVKAKYSMSEDLIMAPLIYYHFSGGQHVFYFADSVNAMNVTLYSSSLSDNLATDLAQPK